MRDGKRLAFDFGQSRIGVAVCDEHAILASPLATVPNTPSLIEAIEAIPDQIIEIYVGLPVNLKGAPTQSTKLAVDFASKIAAKVDCPVRLVDERLTTSLSHSQLRDVGKTQRNSKAIVDQLAAVAILESAIEHERRTGQPPGVTPSEWKTQND